MRNQTLAKDVLIKQQKQQKQITPQSKLIQTHLPSSSTLRTKLTMNLSLAFFVFYSAFHSVNGHEATSLRGRALQDAQASVVASGVGANKIKNRRLQEQEQANTRIIGGSEAVEDRFSYAVSLQYLGHHGCGGSLIAKDVVLTAAH